MTDARPHNAVASRLSPASCCSPADTLNSSPNSNICEAFSLPELPLVERPTTDAKHKTHNIEDKIIRDLRINLAPTGETCRQPKPRTRIAAASSSAASPPPQQPPSPKTPPPTPSHHHNKTAPTGSSR